MKAAIFNAYGEADQMQIATLPKLRVAPGRVLVKVFSAEGDCYARAKRILKPGGVFVCLIPNPVFLVRRLLGNILPGPRFEFLLVKANPRDLECLAALAVRGVLKPPLTLRFSFDQVAEAHRTMERGTYRAKWPWKLSPATYR
ncbi:MAG: zinc-binding dehydrogenase [Cytophagales bacterium]|nr:zinc-binding dehydrogenase [Cytophagales bacterium]